MELYKIAVSVQLRNLMYGGLRRIRDDLNLTDRSVNNLQRNLRGLEAQQQRSAAAMATASRAAAAQQSALTTSAQRASTAQAAQLGIPAQRAQAANDYIKQLAAQQAVMGGLQGQLAGLGDSRDVEGRRRALQKTRDAHDEKLRRQDDVIRREKLRKEGLLGTPSPTNAARLKRDQAVLRQEAKIEEAVRRRGVMEQDRARALDDVNHQMDERDRDRAQRRAREQTRLQSEIAARREKMDKLAAAHRDRQSVLTGRQAAQEKIVAAEKAKQLRLQEAQNAAQSRLNLLKKEELARQTAITRAAQAEAASARRGRLAAGGVAGLVAGGLSALALRGLYKPGADVAREEFLLETTGVTPREMKAIRKAERGVLNEIPTLRADEFRQLYLHTKGTFGLEGSEITPAEQNFLLNKGLPEIAKVAESLRVLDPKRYGDITQTAVSIVRSMDIRALTQREDFGEMMKELQLMGKMVTASGSVLSPQVVQGALKYARQFGRTVDAEFLYQYLPTLMQERMTAGGGAGGRGNVGTMVSSFLSMFGAGRLDRRAIKMWHDLGVLPKESIIRDSSGGRRVDPVKGFVGQELLLKNPAKWVDTIVGPAVIAKLQQTGVRQADGSTKKVDDLDARNQRLAVQNYISRIPGNRTGMDLLSSMYMSWNSIMRDENLRKLAWPAPKLLREAIKKDPLTISRALGASWYNLRQEFGLLIIPTMLEISSKLSNFFRSITDIADANPQLSTAVTGGLALGTTLGVLGGGTALIMAAWPFILSGLGALGSILVGIVSSPIVIGLAALTASLTVLWGVLKFATDADFRSSAIQAADNFILAVGDFWDRLGSPTTWWEVLNGSSDDKVAGQNRKRDFARKSAKLGLQPWHGGLDSWVRAGPDGQGIPLPGGPQVPFGMGLIDSLVNWMVGHTPQEARKVVPAPFSPDNRGQPFTPVQQFTIQIGDKVIADAVLDEFGRLRPLQTSPDVTIFGHNGIDAGGLNGVR